MKARPKSPSRTAKTAKTRKPQSARLLYAASEQNADLLYLGGVFVPDPFAAMQIGSRRSVAAVSALEFARVRRTSRFSEVLPLEELRAAAMSRKDAPTRFGPAQIIDEMARREGVGEFVIAEDFPAGIAFALQAMGYDLQLADGALFPERAQKSAEELKALTEGNKASAAGIAAAADALRKSTVKGGYIYLDGKRLTSERLRTLIDTACLQAGAVASHTICAGGDQACDPHEGGHGPLKAGELIIVDVFPRVSKTGYHGDMTRTFLKGRASEAQKALVAAVREAQQKALATVKAGVRYASIHGAVTESFKQAGYTTSNTGGVWQGFFHSTGHGLGLEVHEAPRVSNVAGTLRAGEVITIEPGLYYPGLGGCRIEDVVAATREGYQALSKAPYGWQIA